MPHVISVMPFQREFLSAAERFLALMAGRRAGKTDAIKSRIKLRTQRPKFSYTYVTPLYSQALEVYNELISDATYKHRIIRHRERPYPHYWLRNGSRVKFKSFQRPEGLRSTGEDEICIDESQDDVVTEHAVKTVVMPMLGDRRGTLVLAGQFRGHDWRYEQYWLRGQRVFDGRIPDFAHLAGQPNPRYNPRFRSWAVHAREGYVFQTPGGREELELQQSLISSGQWAQEWACIPGANAKAAFLPRHIDAIIAGEASARRPGQRYIAGLDLGRVVDQSALVVLEVDTGIVVHAEKLPPRMEHAQQARLVSQVANSYNACVVMDCTGGATGGHAPKDSYTQFYRQTVKDLREFFWSRNNKQQVISELSLNVEQNKIKIPAQFGDLLKELRQYEYEYQNGYYDYHAPRGQHDDYVAALAMAVWGRTRGWAGSSSTFIAPWL